MRLESLKDPNRVINWITILKNTKDLKVLCIDLNLKYAEIITYCSESSFGANVTEPNYKLNFCMDKGAEFIISGLNIHNCSWIASHTTSKYNCYLTLFRLDYTGNRRPRVLYEDKLPSLPDDYDPFELSSTMWERKNIYE